PSILDPNNISCRSPLSAFHQPAITFTHPSVPFQSRRTRPVRLLRIRKDIYLSKTIWLTWQNALIRRHSRGFPTLAHLRNGLHRSAADPRPHGAAGTELCHQS